jgi:unsaturated rhamnogalacturonyl hydrolase
MIPTSASYRSEYVDDFTAMANALAAIQSSDGFWYVSLDDPNDYGGPELTETALFTYGMARGLRIGILDISVFGPIVTNAWCALASAVHTNGFLGYVQSGGTKPSDGQPVTYDSVLNVEDFGLGCFLLASSEVYRLASP